MAKLLDKKLFNSAIKIASIMPIMTIIEKRSRIAEKPYDENILFFMPKSEESYRKIYLTYNSSSKNNPRIKSFINTAKCLCLSK